MNKMSETYTCIECETLFDDTDGNIEKGLCDDCIDMLAEQKRQREIKSVMAKFDELVKWLKGDINAIGS